MQIQDLYLNICFSILPIVDESTEFCRNIWSRISEEKRKSFAYMDSLWFSLYREGYKEKVLNWIKKKKVFSKKYVLVPIVLWYALYIFWRVTWLQVFSLFILLLTFWFVGPTGPCWFCVTLARNQNLVVPAWSCWIHCNQPIRVLNLI